jgi:hypothetical protein
MEEKQHYETFAHLPEISGACLRVMVLDDPKSGIDTLQPYVRFRVQEAADLLDECAKRLAALEKYVELVQSAAGKAFADLVEEFAESRE